MSLHAHCWQRRDCLYFEPKIVVVYAQEVKGKMWKRKARQGERGGWGGLFFCLSLRLASGRSIASPSNDYLLAACFNNINCFL